MRYARVEELPKVLRDTLPQNTQVYFMRLVNDIMDMGRSEADAHVLAWYSMSKKFRQVAGYWVAETDEFTPFKDANDAIIADEESKKVTSVIGLSDEFELGTFKMTEPSVNIVMNGETEEIILDAILASTEPNTEGKYFTETELEQISEQINLLGSTLPDVRHETLMELVKKHGKDFDKIYSELKVKKGVFNSIKSAVKEGKLWVQAVLSKKYKNHVKNFGGLSIEAIYDVDGDRLKNPKYLGFTFTDNPKLKSARIAV